MKLSRAIIIAALLMNGPALAADLHSVMQKDQSFNTNTIDINTGDTILWGNADDVTHNVSIISPDGTELDLGNEKPGVILKHKFDVSGKYRIICHIHPKMKMTVNVNSH